jgi:hypothetical protein
VGVSIAVAATTKTNIDPRNINKSGWFFKCASAYQEKEAERRPQNQPLAPRCAFWRKKNLAGAFS